MDDLLDEVGIALIETVCLPLAQTEAECEIHEAPDASSRSSVPHAVTLRAMLPELTRLFSPGEESLLAEWLDRIAEADTSKARDDKR